MLKDYSNCADCGALRDMEDTTTEENMLYKINFMSNKINKIAGIVTFWFTLTILGIISSVFVFLFGIFNR